MTPMQIEGLTETQVQMLANREYRALADEWDCCVFVYYVDGGPGRRQVQVRDEALPGTRPVAAVYPSWVFRNPDGSQGDEHGPVTLSGH